MLLPGIRGYRPRTGRHQEAGRMSQAHSIPNAALLAWRCISLGLEEGEGQGRRGGVGERRVVG